MSTNTPQTKEQALTTKERFWFRLKLAVAIALVFLFVLIASWLGIIKPVAAADLSNGAFCVKVTNDKEPDIFGMAGAKNCGAVEEEESPVQTPQPNLAIAACIVSSNGLGIFQNMTLTWTSTQAHTGVTAGIGPAGQGSARIPASAISHVGPASGTYTYTLTLNKAQIDSLVGSTYGSTLVVRVDAENEGGMSYGTRNLTINAGGFGATCN